MKKCSRCGHENSDYFGSCEACQNPLPTYESNVNYYSQKSSNEDGAYALVFGILAIVCCGVIFGPLAIIKAGDSDEGTALAGKILGIIGLCLWIISFLFGSCARIM